MFLATEATRTVRSSKPRYPDTRADRHVRFRSGSRNDADNLVSENDRWMPSRDITLDTMEVRAADSASANGYEDLTRRQCRQLVRSIVSQSIAMEP